MKKIIGAFIALYSAFAFSATTVPVQLLNPAGSTSGQAIVSTGASSAPAWGNVTATALAAQAANTVIANVTGSSASPTAFAMPSCSTSASALQWTSGTGFTCNAAVNAATLGGATFAAPGAIGSTTPAAGTFTTLKGNSLAKVFATNTSAQSIPSGANTAVTGWTTGFDANSNFTASTGTFTAPTTGFYAVNAQLTWGVMAGAGASNILKAVVFVNGSASNLVGYAGASNTTQQFNAVQVSGIVSLTAGQTIVLNAVQSTGSSVPLLTSAGAVWMSIYQLP